MVEYIRGTKVIIELNNDQQVEGYPDDEIVMSSDIRNGNWTGDISVLSEIFNKYKEKLITGSHHRIRFWEGDLPGSGDIEITKIHPEHPDALGKPHITFDFRGDKQPNFTRPKAAGEKNAHVPSSLPNNVAMPDSPPTFDLHQLDGQYESPPSFSAWRHLKVAAKRWDLHKEKVVSRKDLSQEVLKRARMIALRTAAIETGAIEDLYKTDRGFTLTIAQQTDAWETILAKRPTEERHLIESQIDVYEHLIDLATEKIPIAEAMIRQLHADICAKQEYYQVWTEAGLQKQPLPKGQYKEHPNHVIKRNGTHHAYAPVTETPIEMSRLCDALRTDEFADAHSVIQAAYAHYTLVNIHPYPDGNGRVARALASIYTYRDSYIPLLILADQRSDYYTALEQTDAGNLQSFVDFIFDCCLDAMQLVVASHSAAEHVPPSKIADKIRSLYVTQSGYTHADIDSAAMTLCDLLNSELTKQCNEINIDQMLKLTISKTNASGQAPSPSLRPLMSIPNPSLQLHGSTVPPANVSAAIVWVPFVPKDYGDNDEVCLYSQNTNFPINFAARVSELLPQSSVSVQLRVRMVATSIISEFLTTLHTEAAKQLGR